MSENHQKVHYENIIDTYDEHYYDQTSMLYRQKYIYKYMWENLDKTVIKDVAEVACGSGANSLSLREHIPNANYTGFDISPTACRNYKNTTGGDAIELDITIPHNFTKKYDLIFVVGGIHHCVADLQQTLNNIAMMLKANGKFIMMEPSSLYFLETVRKKWYKLDKYFDDENEHALNHDELFEMVKEKFDIESVRYGGGPAFFVILNSMILRIPRKLKPIIAPFFFAIEHAWNYIPYNRFHNFFIARWKLKS